MSRAKKYWILFTSCLYISAFTFGGGFVIIPLMRKKFVENLKWLEETEMMDLAAIAQSSPGAIAVNAAILTGYKIGGVLGAMLAMLATILPPMIIIGIISFFYVAFRENVVVNAVLKGMQAGVAAVICDVVIRMGTGVCKEKNVLFILIMAAAFVLTFFLDVNVVYIILGCIALSVIVFFVKMGIRKKKANTSDKICAEIQEQKDGAAEEQAERNSVEELAQEENQEITQGEKEEEK